MIYKKITATIVALFMITSAVALLAPTVGASHTADVDLTPTKVQEGARKLFTLEISNSSGSPDNINKIWITSPDGAFSEAVSGTVVGGNIENAGDNLITASDFLADAADYLSDASTNKENAGDEILNSKGNIDQSADYLLWTAYHKAGTEFKSAVSALTFVGENLSGSTTDIGWTVNQLSTAANAFNVASENFLLDGSSYENFIGDNYVDNMLDNVSSYLSMASTRLNNGDISAVEVKLGLAAEALENAAENMKKWSKDNNEAPSLYIDLSPGVPSIPDNAQVVQAGMRLSSAATNLSDAALEFETMDNNLLTASKDFGLAMSENASRALYDAGLNLENVSNLENAGDNLINAGIRLGDSADNLRPNLFTARTYMYDAGENENMAGAVLGQALGGDYLQDAATAMMNAGENIQTKTKFNLATAADEISTSAGYLEDAGNALGDAGDNMQTTGVEGWNFDTSGPTTDTIANWDAIGTNNEGENTYEGENTLAPGEDIDLAVLLKSIEASDHDLVVFTEDTDGSVDSYTFTIEVDGTPPALSGRVYQEKVGENNVIGDEYDNGMANVEITADEEVTSLGPVKVVVNGENMVAVDMSTEDDEVFTGEFMVENWDENNVSLWVGSATDTFGNENSFEDNLVEDILVDTRAPVWDDTHDVEAHDNSGVNTAVEKYTTPINNRDQDPENVKATNLRHWTANGEVKDNTAGNWSGVKNVYGIVNGEVVEVGALHDENLFSCDDLDLISEGIKTVGVRAVDKTGNIVENTVENVLFDNTSPYLDSFYPDNGAILNDNKITVTATVIDEWLGLDNVTMRYENIEGAFMDNGDNFARSYTLENNGHVEFTDNEWTEKEHTIWIYADDRINENLVTTWSFRVDVTAPDPPVVTDLCVGGVCDPVTVEEETLEVTGEANKSSWEDWSDISVNVYVNGELQQEDVSVDDDGEWATNITLSPGSNNIEVTQTDAAGNVSDMGDAGYVDLDITPTIDETVGGSSGSPGLMTRNSEITVDGTGMPNSTINVYVNGSEATTATVDANRQWSAAVGLSEGMNRIQVTSSYDGYETGRVNYGYVLSDTEAPSVSITSPSDGSSTGERSVTVEATVDDAVAAPEDLDVSVRSPAYTVPEQEVSVGSDGSLVIDVPLQEGSNTITVIAEDEVGHSTTGNVTVTRTVAEARDWQMYALILAIIAIILAAIAIIRRSV
ncbi:hypothetical protein AKJ56_01130 [candidate division MSBL1 archaeon SCGC-AAA382N08]|uniref:Bacterial Ig-like domain-containing protein n=1 Tax=candidate division MSBL1 archaeon SCGC-AAA382N08 TaxID=1698285 RepID=A0A133VQ05_9EURY|nr:hypothetical protein AKJ56_01130 [candidate division MSBL1 archaeon SCGC-AAA382N08]